MRYVVLIVCLLSAPLLAHEFVLEPRDGGWVLVFGHGEKEAPYRADTVTDIVAVDQQGQFLSVERTTRGPHVWARTSTKARAVLATIDTGYWVKTTEGWKNRSKRGLKHYIQARREVQYSKSLVGREPLKTPLGAELEIVPAGSLTGQKPGAKVPVVVLLRGKPVAGAAVESGEHQDMGKSDASGRSFGVLDKDGGMVVTASWKEPVSNSPDTDQLYLKAVLHVVPE